ncbi:hypothetical protein RHMOL_Rhmol06G0320500 [Rhododendron molle]|uniref:Uncharacterized protein n=1 Tax=Rhododendron molle TaxID=49168 RepID=A0ACC0NIP0_RHOML|nr:hypothetical protein RHMOL_Rhmol06G0320500 [Rhododendron molle]
MVSPRAGRGIGTRTSPRKGVAQSLQLSNRNVNDRAKWTPSLTRCLLEACAEESDEHGRALNGFSYQGWQRIVRAFAMKSASTWDGFWNGGLEWGNQQRNTSLEGTWNPWPRVSNEESQYGGEYDGTRYTTCNRDTPSTSQMHSDEAYLMGNTRLVAEEVNEAESDEQEDNEEELDESDEEDSDEEEEDEEESDEEESNDDEENSEESDEEEGMGNIDLVNAVHERDLYVIQQLMEEVDENRPNKKQKIPYLTSANNGLEWVMSTLNSENARKCPEVFGMKKEVFGLLCNEMVNKYDFHIGTKRAIGVVESFAMFLCLLRGQTLKQIQEQFQRGQATCSRQINKVLRCMLKLAADEIKPKRGYNDPHPYLQARPQYRHFKVRSMFNISPSIVKCKV